MDLVGRQVASAAATAQHVTLGFEDGGALRVWASAEGLKPLLYPPGQLPPEPASPLVLPPGAIVASTPTGRYVEPPAPREPPPSTGDAALDDHFYGPENWDAYVHHDPTPRFHMEALALLFDHGACLVLTASDGPTVAVSLA
jgi:hypothetical protein